ncbi:unnamed protein product [marine sediment metagenome]|uniref:Uncharacterized protein n=1 Tax=marine sediment metagenome TaxID=412755 RepID=X1A2J6_9ZZZZ
MKKDKESIVLDLKEAQGLVDLCRYLLTYSPDRVYLPDEYDIFTMLEDILNER